MTPTRRRVGILAVAAAAVLAATGARAYDQIIRIGFQKYGKLVLLKS